MEQCRLGHCGDRSCHTCAVNSAALVALLVSAVAFGISHIGGGIAYVALATLAGIGYGAAYHFTQRVEASILVHFTVNLVHLTFFHLSYRRIDAP